MPVALKRSTLSRDVDAYCRDIVRLAGAGTAIAMRADPEVPRDTGRMASMTSAGAAPQRSGTRTTIKLRNPSPIAGYTDKGTEPHVIVPRRRGGRLVFFWPKVGATVFLRRVHHPGSKMHKGWFEARAAHHWPEMCRRAVQALGTR